MAQEANYPIRDRRPPAVRAAEKASSAAARDAAALEYTLGLDVCTDVAARKHVFFALHRHAFYPSLFICMFAFALKFFYLIVLT